MRSPVKRKIATIGSIRLDFERLDKAHHQYRRFRYRHGGQATQWPWREFEVPFVGSFVLGRAKPIPEA